MSGQEQRPLREVFEKAYERLLPAAGYLISNQAGFAASVIVFTTWLMRRLRGDKAQVQLDVEKDEEALIGLKLRLDNAYERLDMLKRSLEEASPWQRERIERSMRAVESEIEDLENMYELIELRILAVKKLQSLGETGVLRNALSLARQIEEGKIEDAQYVVLKELEDEWRRRQMSIEALRRILESPWP